MLKPDFIDISELTPHPNNPRLIKDESFHRLCKSIQSNPEYFEARPIIYSNRTEENIIIAGNMRYKAAAHLRLTTVPAVLIPNLTEEKEREIMIRDNISNGLFDMDMLANEWDEHDLLEWGVDVDFLCASEEVEEKPEKEECIKRTCEACGQKIKE